MTDSARILIVAGSDSGGGAGIQADIKSVTALGGYAMTAITALTAQNTTGVQAVLPVDAAFIRQQMRSVIEDLGVDCGKTGMLHDSEVIATVAATWSELAAGVPLVVDPVMVAQSGDRLIRDEAVVTLRDRLAPLATVLTPNVPEAEVLAGRALRGTDDMEALAGELLALGCGAVLLKGGHLGGTTVTDLLLVRGQPPLRLESPRVETTSDHGTGCTLASAIATGLGQGMALADAVRRARAYLLRALQTARPLGHGHGPVNHGHTVAPFPGDR